jgi:cytidine deaminase
MLRFLANVALSTTHSPLSTEPLVYTTHPMSHLSAEMRERLIAQAKHAMQKAYAPYSKFHVGAAILTADGNVFSGCNVENASYGLTICAERNAIFAAVAAAPNRTKLALSAVAVVNNQELACSPCGACRQVIAEFGKDAIVIYQGEKGMKESTISQLLPDGFVL